MSRQIFPIVPETFAPFDFQKEMIQADWFNKKIICIEGDAKESIQMVHRIVKLLWQMTQVGQLTKLTTEKPWAPG